ncbi:tRNA (guanine-N(1)-)-methyltransferase [Frankliniella fusca]|uniref:tRNA (Guanine-N(1)-)-methyltransferase n=1 Tax=Frankliniella fusca TaxID=407009 RepID=A0AAE1HK95_9NEOP|nr:tRNA (guanine-N(1)-)-methyltransferase [Frankliniella fusca]
MNGSRHAFSLLARCRGALRPQLPISKCDLNRCFVAQDQRRLYSSSNDSPRDYDSLPSLPISNPVVFMMDLAGRNFKQINWCIAEQKLDRDVIFTANESAEQILKFVTNCLAEGDFDTLEEKFIPEALTKAQSLVALMNPDKKKDLVFPGSSKSIFFASELAHFSPWNFGTENSNLIFTYIGLLVNAKGQRTWLLTLSIPKESETTLSEDFKVKKFDYATYATPDEKSEE